MLVGLFKTVDEIQMMTCMPAYHPRASEQYYKGHGSPPNKCIGSGCPMLRYGKSTVYEGYYCGMGGNPLNA